MATDLTDLLACPRCDKTPLAFADGVYSCGACKIDFPSIDGIPWLFAEPQAMAVAARSLPVPLSPVIKTVLSVGAIVPINL